MGRARGTLEKKEHMGKSSRECLMVWLGCKGLTHIRNHTEHSAFFHQGQVAEGHEIVQSN